MLTHILDFSDNHLSQGRNFHSHGESLFQFRSNESSNLFYDGIYLGVKDCSASRNQLLCSR